MCFLYLLHNNQEVILTLKKMHIHSDGEPECQNCCFAARGYTFDPFSNYIKGLTNSQGHI